jgi:hypothetical protein
MHLLCLSHCIMQFLCWNTFACGELNEVFFTGWLASSCVRSCSSDFPVWTKLKFDQLHFTKLVVLITFHRILCMDILAPHTQNMQLQDCDEITAYFTFTFINLFKNSSGKNWFAFGVNESVNDMVKNEIGKCVKLAWWNVQNLKVNLSSCCRTVAHESQFFLVVKNWQISIVHCPWNINYLHTEVL